MRLLKNVCVGAVVGFFTVTWADVASAHHSFAMFDNTKTVTVAGTVKEFQWTNPHCWIQLIVVDGAGHPVEWSIEGTSPNNLIREGWKRSTLKPGDKAEVVMHPLRDGTAGGSMVRASVNGKPVQGEDGPPPA